MSSRAEPVVKLVKVFKYYRSRGNVVKAVDGVDAEMHRGRIACIVGPSGSGKTTLLNLIGGLDKPDGGRVIVDGVEVSSLSEAELAEFRLRRIGFVFQFLNLIPTLTAYENVELPLALLGLPKEERKRRVEEILDLVGLSSKAHRYPDELSGGEQQRVAIARALVKNPAVVLMDEPTAHVDSETGLKLMKLISGLNKKLGQTFVIATHDPVVVEHCTDIFHLRDGRIWKTESRA